LLPSRLVPKLAYQNATQLARTDTNTIANVVVAVVVAAA